MKTKRILSVMLCIVMLVACIPYVAVSADNSTLRFNDNGKFKIVVFADCQDDETPVQSMIGFMNAALDYEKPDLVIFTGDNVVVNTLDKFRQGASAIIQPLIDRNIPYAYTYGNHDDQSGVTKEQQFNVYSQLGTCLTYDDDPSITGFGNCNIPIYASDSNNIAYNLWIVDSNTYATDGGLYDYVHRDQINWYLNKSALLAEREGHKVDSMWFQHIIVPEAYDLLEEGGLHSYNGKTYKKTLNSNASGYLGEFPCPPDTNSGQFSAIADNGDVVAMFFGHDHSNSFTGHLKGVDLVAVPGVTLNSYGDEKARGCGVIEINENNTSVYSYKTLKYSDYVNGYLTTVSADKRTYTLTPGEEYIYDIIFSDNMVEEKALTEITERGYIPIRQDLNEGARGHYIFMGYKTTTNVSEALTNILFYSSEEDNRNHPINVNYDNIRVEYRSMSNVDLNNAAGGDYIYCYATNNPLAGGPIKAVSFSDYVISGLTYCGSVGSPTTPADLNNGTRVHNKSIYCSVERVPSLDYSKLENIIAENRNFKPSLYDTKSAELIVAALNNAQHCLNSVKNARYTACTQAEVDACVKAVTDAFANAKIKEFTVVFKNYDGTVLSEQNVAGNECAATPRTPSKPSDDYYNYVFSGWDKDYSCVTSDMVIYAQYDAVHYHTPGAEATCTKPQYCLTCNEIIIAAKGHTPDPDIGCEQAQQCLVCHEYIGPGEGHIPVLVRQNDATCREKGYTGDIECSKCHKILESGAEIPTKAHTPGAAPTCEKPQVCTVCGTELAPAKGHLPGAVPTCTRDQRCVECGKVLLKATGHKPSAKDPSVCEYCGEKLQVSTCGCCDEHNHGNSLGDRIACFFCKIKHFFMRLFNIG